MSDQRLIVGIDGGGTSTRVRIAHLDGTVAASAQGTGVNPNSGSDPFQSLTNVLGEALAGLTADERSRISTGVAGLAGYLSSPDLMTRAAESAWSAAGLPGKPTVCSDLVIAYWSGYARTGREAPSQGTILIAGTGAVAAAVHGTDLENIVDGGGYLLGDFGAGAWLGIRAAQAALDSAAGRGPATILEQFVFNGEEPQAWLGKAYSRPPREIASLAPLVSRAYEEGDVVAREIVDLAAAELSKTAVAAGAGSASTSIVVAGSIAAGKNPVGEALRSRLAGLGLTIIAGADGLDGAVELASRSVLGTWPMN